MSRAPVEKYHFEVSKGIGGNLAIQAGRHTAGERAGERKMVTHQLGRKTNYGNPHTRGPTKQGRGPTKSITKTQLLVRTWTRTYMYMFGLN